MYLPSRRRRPWAHHRSQQNRLATARSCSVVAGGLASGTAALLVLLFFFAAPASAYSSTSPSALDRCGHAKQIFTNHSCCGDASAAPTTCDVGSFNVSILENLETHVATLMQRFTCDMPTEQVLHGHYGDCNRSLFVGESCEISCNNGYQSSGRTTCAVDRLYVATCNSTSTPTLVDRHLPF